MSHRFHRSLNAVLCGLIALAGLAGLGAAHAEEGERSARVALSPTYRAECSGCHLAYPPGMLPAASWKRLVDNLPRHFGTDASLDAATTKQLSTWLVANAGSARRVSEAPPDDRISRSAWFVRQHDEISPQTWKRPAVHSAANCAACHPRADQGDFNEHAVRIPR